MELKHIAFNIFIFELIIIAILIIIIYLTRITYKIAIKRKSKKIKQLRHSIVDCLSKKIYFDPQKIKFDKHIKKRDLLNILEDFDRNFKGSSWQAFKDDVSETLLLTKARKLASSRSWYRRNFASRCFDLCPKPKDEKIILKLLDDPLYLVNSKAASALVKLDSKEGIHKILTLMGLEYGFARISYEDILLKGTESTYKHIEKVAETQKDLKTHLACLDTLDSLEMVITQPFLLKDVESDNLELRLAATQVFAYNLQPDSEKILFKAMDDQNEDIRAVAANGLGHFANERNIQKLSQAMKDTSWKVRLQAAMSLKSMGEAGKKAMNQFDINNDKDAYEVALYASQLSW